MKPSIVRQGRPSGQVSNFDLKVLGQMLQLDRIGRFHQGAGHLEPSQFVMAAPGIPGPRLMCRSPRPIDNLYLQKAAIRRRFAHRFENRSDLDIWKDRRTALPGGRLGSLTPGEAAGSPRVWRLPSPYRRVLDSSSCSFRSRSNSSKSARRIAQPHHGAPGAQPHHRTSQTKLSHPFTWGGDLLRS